MERIFPSRPSGLERQQTLFLDAVEVLTPAVDLFYRRMLSAATDYEAAMRGREVPEGFQLSLVSDVIAFVGTVQRLRLVVKRLPGTPEVRLAKRAFEAEVSKYEPARHHFEHLDERIPQIAATGHGPFGGISWQTLTSEGLLITMIAPGSLGGSRAVAVTRSHSTFRPPTDHFYASIGGDPYYLTGAHDAVIALANRLRDWSESIST